MYNLGEQFNIDYQKALSDSNGIIKGEKYRITVMTERLLRLEYSENGKFEDRPTELALNRLFKVPKFEIKQDEYYIELATSYFKLSYVKNKNFKDGAINRGSNLKVKVIETDKTWYYGHPEAKKYNGSFVILPNKKNNNVLYRDGLYSIDGFATIDDSNSQVFLPTGTLKTKEERQIDIYLFAYGKDFDSAIKDYFELTGYPALIPRYALGNWWSKNDDYNDYSLKELLSNFEREEIPLSVLMLEKGWHTTNKNQKISSGFNWNEELFKAPAGMINYLHKKGIKLGLSINPNDGFYKEESKYEELNKYIEADKNGVLPFNVFDPKTVDVYLKLLIHPLDEMGVSFYWLDCFDINKLKENWLLSHYHFKNMEKNNNKRPMIYSVNNLIAPHRYPVTYSGKTVVGWDALREMPKFILSGASSGVSFISQDIGGYFRGIEEPELYERFVELGVFSPIMKFGSDKGKYYKKEPWKWNIKSYEIVKDYLQLRYKLIPYLYSEAYRYHKEGVNLIEPIYYNYPETYDDKSFVNEYFFGSQLFVAPIIKEKDLLIDRSIQSFFLPDGIWYDLKSGKKFLGSRKYILFYEDDDYPVFARIGAIIPFADDSVYSSKNPESFDVHIFPGKTTSYNLYEDDGETNLYKQGEYLITSIQYSYAIDNYTVTIKALEGRSEVVPNKRNYKIRFRNTKQMDETTVYFNNEKLESKAYIDNLDFVVEVKNVPTIGQLTVNCKGNNVMMEAFRMMNDDIQGILNDLKIDTLLKEKLDAILFSDRSVKKKRIEIRKLKSKGLESKYVKIFLKLLEYISQV